MSFALVYEASESVAVLVGKKAKRKVLNRNSDVLFKNRRVVRDWMWYLKKNRREN